ncbi:hypothetical protein [Hymenobacter metallilatus]|uniref:Uncharacterized protein n=1 Tax=Hymenobacter metallilatus TaxID=2493666 RepID=A0A428JLV7_9BACT|nr:hypothetical protein [Hymenobacter metallilatus]RSK33933.1 hypothetical protein EI290_09515 [Hymenobacter metallilatus]
MKLTFIAPARPGQAKAKTPTITLSLLGGRIGFNGPAAELLDLDKYPHLAVAKDEEDNVYLVGFTAATGETATVQRKAKTVSVSHSAAVREIIDSLPAKTFGEASSISMPLAAELTVVPGSKNTRVVGLLTAGATVLRVKKGKEVSNG